MSHQAVVDLIRQSMMTAFWLSLPLLAVGFVAGVLISLLQIVTSIQDPAFGSVPRLAAFLAGLVILLPWMLIRMCNFTEQLLGNLGAYAR